MERYRITADFRAENISKDEIEEKCEEVGERVKGEVFDLKVSWKRKSYIKDGILFCLTGAIWLTALSMGMNNDLLTEFVSGVLLWPWNIFSQFVQESKFLAPMLVAGNAFYWVLLGIACGWAYQLAQDIRKDLEVMFDKRKR